MNSYSVSKHCSSCALRQKSCRKKSKPVGMGGLSCSRLHWSGTGLGQQRLCNSSVCFILCAFPTSTLNKHHTLFYSFPTGLHLPHILTWKFWPQPAHPCHCLWKFSPMGTSPHSLFTSFIWSSLLLLHYKFSLRLAHCFPLSLSAMPVVSHTHVTGVEWG